MRFFNTLAAFLFLISLQAQEIVVSGKVISSYQPVEAAHIRALHTNEQTITNALGEFSLPASVSDTLIISHVGYETLTYYVSDNPEIGDPLTLYLTEKSFLLEDVTVQGFRSMNAVELGILTKLPEKLTTNERKLRTAGDFKAIHLLGILGGALPIDPIINKISGRTQRLKKQVQADNEAMRKKQIHENYGAYITSSFNLQNEYLERFLDYAVFHGAWDDFNTHQYDPKTEFHLTELYHAYVASIAPKTEKVAKD